MRRKAAPFFQGTQERIKIMNASAEHHSKKDKTQEDIERLNDVQILLDEADDVPVPISVYDDPIGLYLLSPSGALPDPAKLALAEKRLTKMGFKVKIDKAADAKHLRFAGTDKQRAQAFSRAAKDSSTVVMATRGGYGISRILHQIDWKLLENNPKKYIGYSDFTAFNLALLAKTGLSSYTGPAAVSDFGNKKIDDLTAEIFVESMRGELEILSFESPDSDAVDARGTLWGGNLAMIASLVGTPYLPKIKNGILFLEDVGEHPYRVERMLTHLLHAGILHKQKAIVLGHITDYKLAENDNGYDMPHVIKWLKEQVNVPLVYGLPYGHGDVRVTLPIGKKVGIATEDGMAYLVLEEHEHTHDAEAAIDDLEGYDHFHEGVHLHIHEEPKPENNKKSGKKKKK